MDLYIFTSFPLQEDAAPGEAAAVEEFWGPGRNVDVLGAIPPGSTIIPRFRAIPFGREVEKEVHLAGSHLINSYRQHRALADSSSWSHLLEGLTPPQYSLEDIPHLPEGEWFVKGETNSVKNQWLEKTYAPTTRDLPRVVNNFLNDGYVGNQRVVIKPYRRWRQLTQGVTGQPIFHERRVFLLLGEVIAEGFYWDSFREEVGEVKALDESLYAATLQEAASRLKPLAPFMVVDLAEDPAGSWEVVEVNDGSMSGLSGVDPRVLWRGFKEVWEAHGRKQ